MQIEALEHEFELASDLIYLNHAAVSPWPRRTAAAVRAFAEENLHEGSRHYLQWQQTEQRLRERLQRLIGARGVDEIALLKNTSEGLSFVAAGLDWHSGDNVVITNQEFPSNRVVWESLRPRGVEVRYADVSVEDPEQAVIDRVDDRTRLVALSAVQYGTGLRLDLRRIGRHCEDAEVLFCVDAIQQIGALPFDVREARADFVVADGHKWMLAPEGLALFYCRRELLQKLQPLEYGWHMLADPGNFDNPDWQVAADARRFECGSPNMLGTYALEASLSLLEEIGMDRIGEAVLHRSQRIVEGVRTRFDHYELITRTQPERLAGIVTFRPLQEPVDDLFQRLRAAGVQCAQRAGGIRVSPHAYTPLSVIRRFLELL
ncbi:aminotransferase class V-fold PLP-dependent enzyme [Thiohalobacter thiocyanaticus]|uniref:Aminotransferase class V-fold PLP-dependent enzyme n=1 Tax=Thiohalobacter thiocyanaticus TaxID=585455 RepID=A0A426QFP6_9GAMM|nr:aminotransferase class V-fold PLP-dependent enzyme [Thiohalobacter thiocyanaticus]RRQ20569.1 aminotransferase class V-fold PLP-dependent enzyme [Thiohalobacter thiocyanaticus]